MTQEVGKSVLPGRAPDDEEAELAVLTAVRDGEDADEVKRKEAKAMVERVLTDF